VISRVFHDWERRLADRVPARTIRPFGWGLEWIGETDGHGDASACAQLERWADQTVAGSDAFYQHVWCNDYRLDGDRLSFTSAVATPHIENNTVRARYFPDASRAGRRRAVLVLPQWNADAEGHVALCQLLNRCRITALRLSLPYHDDRMPPELTRADYIVSANLGRTAQVCRQAVLDARRAIHWLASQGYESIGILGTSLGSCLSMLTAAHEPLVRAAAFNHISPYFADVVWNGLSTQHVRAGLEGHIDLHRLRRIWMPISPFPYLERLGGKPVLLVYARYDLTFPVNLSRLLLQEFRRRGVDYDLTVLPCGHYSTGVPPFNWIAGLKLCRFLARSL
jgi:dienelactone hydrolase